MKYKQHKRIKVVHAKDADTFETQINKTLSMFPDAEIPEDVTDQFHQQGIYYHCRNCPHMEPPKDGRFKWCECDISPWGKTRMDSEACEYFYKALLTGAIKRSELKRD